MRCIILESPFRGKDFNQALLYREYADACIRDSIERGESPYASHRIIPGALDDSIPAERDKGIRAGMLGGNTRRLSFSISITE
jgi:hypothetical protein